MKNTLKQTVFILLTGLLSMTSKSQAADFKLVQSQQNIALYERWIQHNGNNVRELKAEFTVKTNGTPQVIQLLKDAGKGNVWNPNASAYKIRLLQNTSWLTYIRYKTPFPMDDQDCCLKYFYADADASKPMYAINFESMASNNFPLQKNVTRITGIKGKWLIENKGNGTTKITYQIVSDKSASIPRWVSDPIIHNNLFTTISSFKKLLEARS